MSPVLRFARKHLRPYLPWYLAGTAALVLTNGIMASIPLVAAEGIDALPERAPVLRAALHVALLGGVVIAVRTASRLLFFTPGRFVEVALRRDLFEAVLRQREDFLGQFPTGDLVNRTNSDVGNVRMLAGFVALALLNAMTATATVGVQLARLDPWLAIWTLTTLCGATALSMMAVQRMLALVRKIQEAGSALADAALQAFQGVSALQAWQAEASIGAQVGAIAERWRALNQRRSQLRVAIGPMLGLSTAIGTFGLLWTADDRVANGSLTSGEIVAFVALVGTLASPLRSVSFVASLARQATASIERIEAILDAPVERPDLPNPTPAPTRPPTIQLRHLTFAWPGAPTPALSNLSIDIPAGATVGIVGPTGSGKSTLLQLLARRTEPPREQIFVDGADLAGIDLLGWRAATTFVPQKAFLFSESVRDNIALGRPVDVMAIAERAALHDDLASLANGLDTIVGEAGTMLSGGQRQRVALARGLAREPVLLVLDDVLSAVDATTERALLATLANAGQRPTTLIVSHRLSAVKDADLIVVLDQGRAVETGTHGALLARNGSYAELWRLQTTEAE